jgi:shikimate dehydrogenase
MISDEDSAAMKSPATITGTAVFGIFGKPVSHSLSPHMHRTAYRHMGIQASYEAWHVDHPRDIIQRTRAEDVRGASITMPFKEAVLGFLDEVDQTALAIGSVNTIHTDGGRLKGYNTDWIGLIRDLGGYLDIRGKSFAVIGAGGTARAAVFGILKCGGIPVILNKTPSKGAALAHALGCRAEPLEAITGVGSDVLINTTPVGMAPDVDKTPIKMTDLGRFKYVIDVIYNPIETKLLRDAKAAGCTTINGVGMFVHQGAEQIRIWTGMDPPIGLMRQAVEAELAIRSW